MGNLRQKIKVSLMENEYKYSPFMFCQRSVFNEVNSWAPKLQKKR